MAKWHFMHLCHTSCSASPVYLFQKPIDHLTFGPPTAKHPTLSYIEPLTHLKASLQLLLRLQQGLKGFGACAIIGALDSSTYRNKCLKLCLQLELCSHNCNYSIYTRWAPFKLTLSSSSTHAAAPIPLQGLMLQHLEIKVVQKKQKDPPDGVQVCIEICYNCLNLCNFVYKQEAAAQ